MTPIRQSRVSRASFRSIAKFWLLLVAIASIAASLKGADLAAQTSTLTSVVPSRITMPVSDANLVTLKGSTPASARAEFDQGAVPDSTPAEHIQLLLKRSDAQEAELKQLVTAQHDPTSPKYHQWLTGEQFGASFGPSQSDLDQVRSWLQSQGFTINKTSVGKVAIDFSGTASMVRTAFHTELHTYQRNGVTFHSNSSDPAIPAALAPVVAGVVSLNDIKPVASLRVLGSAAFNPKTHTAKPSWNYATPCYDKNYNLTTCTYFVPAPADLAIQYGLTAIDKAGTTGAGETIGIIGDSNVDLGVVQNYRTLFGFKNTANLPQVIVDGNDPGQNGDSTESFLDVEAASAMAPDATVNLYVSTGSITTSGIVNAIVRAVDDNAADVLSLSYGECEQNLGPAGNQFAAQMWQQAAAQGQSVVVSTGDGGSAGCDNFNYSSQASGGVAVNGLASTPYNTAVGGTDFYYSDYAKGMSDPGLQAQLEAAWGGYSSTLTPSTTLVAPLQEQPWNDGLGLNVNGDPNAGYDIVAGSGGASSCVTGSQVDPTTGAFGVCAAGYPKPSWQTGKGVPADGVRDLPDVSLFASAGENLSFWPICEGVYDCRASLSTPGESVTVSGVGGTSAATPAMAGIVALLDQTMKGRQGNLNYKLYALAAQFPTSFNDVTVGSNNVPCVQGTPNCSLDTNGDGLYTLQSYSAGPGYDLASGLGSINAANLFANWNNANVATGATQTTLSFAQSTFVHGAAVNASVTVTGTGGTPTGAVAIEAAIPGQTGQGAITLSGGKGTGPVGSLPGGTYSVTGVYSGDGTFAPSTSSPVSVTITAEPSTTSLTAQYLDRQYTQHSITAGAALSYGDAYYIDGVVIGKSGLGLPTGTATLSDNGAVIGTANVDSSGTAEFVIGKLAPGSHSLTIAYPGDASFAASTSAPLAFTVAKGDPFVYYEGVTGTYGAPAVAGLPLELPVIISAGSYNAAPSGTVTITLGSGAPQTATLSTVYQGVAAGAASVFITAPPVGKYPLTVQYSGDSNFNTAGLTYTTNITVTAPAGAATTTTLSSNTSTVGPDDAVVLTAKVFSSILQAVPTGYVGFNISGVPFYYETKLDATGTATVTIGGQGVPTGSHVLTAVYLGDSTFAPSTSSTVPINSNQGDFSIVASSQNLSITSGSSATTTLSLASILFSNAEGDGFAGPANLTCTTSSPSFTCSLASNTVTLTADGKPQTVLATINTRILTANSEVPIHGMGKPIFGGGAVLAMLFFFIPRGRRLSRGLLLGMVMSFVLVGMGPLGCSSGSSTPPPTSTTPPGTNAAAGTYQVLISANASGIQHSLLIHVQVQ